VALTLFKIGWGVQQRGAVWRTGRSWILPILDIDLLVVGPAAAAIPVGRAPVPMASRLAPGVAA